MLPPFCFAPVPHGDDRVHHITQHAGAALVLAHRGCLVLGVKAEELRLREEEHGEQRGLGSKMICRQQDFKPSLYTQRRSKKMNI